MRKPLLGITLGDPAGIGPWVSVGAALDARVQKQCRPLLIGDAWVVQHFCQHPRLRVNAIIDINDYLTAKNTVNILHVPHPHIRTLSLGHPQKVSGESAALSIRTAVALAFQKRVAGIVTGPVSKESFQLAGLPFTGHTEMLSALSGVAHAEMVMAAGPLKTVLITRHIPFKDVFKHLSQKRIVSAVTTVDSWLKKQMPSKRKGSWALCGLNPHAGDNGLLGKEEKQFIAPAIKSLRSSGLKIEGPVPADAAWARHAAGQYDIVACLYHDQGMIPLKTMHPYSVVNITAGLPFVRTSPGHGTAFDLAKSKRPYAQADTTATIQAALSAIKLSVKNKV